MSKQKSRAIKATPKPASPYDHDLICATMTLNHMKVADVAITAKVATKTVSAIRNGKPQVQVDKLKRVVDAIGLPMAEIFRDKAVRALA